MPKIKSTMANMYPQLRKHVYAKCAAMLFFLPLLSNVQAAAIGNIDGITSDSAYPHILIGWACSTGLNQSIDVHVYAGGSAGSGTFVGAFKADSISEPGVASACGAQGSNYRFRIPLTTSIRKQYAGQKLYVHAISPIGQPNDLLSASGLYSTPGLSTVSVTRSYVYDEKQRLCKTIEPETRATLYDYDGAGNVIWSASGQELMSNTCDRASVPAAEKTNYVYDAMNRVTSVTYPDGINNTTSTYEADGKLKTLVSNGSTWTFEYNKRRLLTKETLNFYSNYVNTYGYTANGHVASYSTNHGTVVDYAPNALGQATQASGYASNVQYHPNGSMKQFTYGNGIVYTMTQNDRQLPDITSYKLGTNKIAEFDLNFDPNGNVLNNLDLAQAGRTDRSMAYDGLDRLTQVYAPNMWGMANYQYDALDNLRRSTLGLAGFNYYYDANNRVQRIDRDASGSYAYTFDARGNVLSDGRNNYNFTRANRLSAVTGKETYQYDGFGRRVVGFRQDGSGFVPVYSADGVLRYSADNRKAGGTTHVILNGSQIAEVFKRWSDLATTITYTHTDALGSPVATTDTAGSIINRTEYAPFGAPFNRPVDGVGYTGHVMDQATGLVYAQQRYYDPMIGKFLSVDPVAADPNAGANFNRYWYGNNNPYKFTDPDGRIGTKTNSGAFHEDSGQKAEVIPSPNIGAQNAQPNTVPTNVNSDAVIKGKGSDIAFGLVEMVISVHVGADSGAVAIIAAASGQEELATAAGGGVIVGALGFSDGANRVMNGLDGGNRRSTLGEVGEYVFGEQGGNAGDAASFVMGVNGLATATSAATKTDSVAQAAEVVVSGEGVVSDINDVSRDK